MCDISIFSGITILYSGKFLWVLNLDFPRVLDKLQKSCKTNMAVVLAASCSMVCLYCCSVAKSGMKSASNNNLILDYKLVRGTITIIRLVPLVCLCKRSNDNGSNKKHALFVGRDPKHP